MKGTEQEFYCFIVKCLDVDMASKGINYDDLTKESDYIIKRQTYFNVLGVCNGNIKSPRLSHTKLKALCKYLEIDITKIQYFYNKL